MKPLNDDNALWNVKGEVRDQSAGEAAPACCWYYGCCWFWYESSDDADAGESLAA